MTGVDVSSTARATLAGPRPRRIGAWVAIGVALLLVGGAGAALSEVGQRVERGTLDPESAGPGGTRAIVRILERNGVEVILTRSRAEAAALLSEEPRTLVLPDAPALSDQGLAALAADAADLVVLDPRSRTLDLFLSGSAPAGRAGDETAAAECAVAAADRAARIEPGAVYSAGPGVAACFPAAGGAGLLVHESGTRRAWAFDARAVIANDSLARSGHAALGLGILGGHPTVVWYLPTLGDSDLEDTDPSLGELTPPWVSPVIVVLLAAGLAAAIWRGRRFGPLVAERLPVTVRAGETAEGRARLYARARDTAHAARLLRRGSQERIARMLGLGATASAPAVADAAAAASGADPRAVRGVLVDDTPAGDADLVRLSTALRDLERAVHAATRYERNPR